MNPFGTFSLEAKLIAGAVALLALLAGVLWVVHDLEAAGAAKAAAAEAKAAAAATAANAAETTRRETAQQENLREANTFNAAAAVDARDLAAVVQRMRVAAAGGRGATIHSGAAAGSSPASGAGMVPADVFLELVDRAAGLAEYADSARIAGQLCERDYGALKP